MRYLLLICDDETVSSLTPDQRAEHEEWRRELTERGIYLRGDRLRPVAEATSVRSRGGETLVADGPFAETKELVGGYVLIEAADLDEAVGVAARHPVARYGTIEVRPLWEMT